MIFFRTFFFVIVLISYLSASNFAELNGFDDDNDNTHLFYRIYTKFSTGGTSYDIYHLDLSNNSDSLYLEEYYSPAIFPEPYGWPSYKSVDDFEFWNRNPVDVIYCGIENDMLMGKFYLCSSRFDYYWGPAINNLELSNQNDSLAYASEQWGGLIISFNSGYEWQNLNPRYSRLLDISPFNDQILFATNGKYLHKSTDGGITFSIVDSSGILEKEFLFDSDSTHIYLVSGNKILTSGDCGESWHLLYEDSVKVFVSLDESNSGAVYLCRKNQILFSQNFGASFNLYTSLESNIGGIYKKPNSDKLYISTIDHIYQISKDELITLKIITSISDNEFSASNPRSFHLYQNYPNPFNSSTTIRYQIIQSGHVEIRVYSIDGKLVDTLVDKQMLAGDFSIQWAANDLASGMYFYILIYNGKIRDTKRLLLIN